MFPVMAAGPGSAIVDDPPPIVFAPKSTVRAKVAVPWTAPAQIPPLQTK